MTGKKIAVFWFRKDLRFHDNAGLYHALTSGRPVLPLFIFDKNILTDLPESDPRVLFIHQTVKSLNQNLPDSGMLVKYGEPLNVWKNLIQEYDIIGVYLNRDYEPAAIERDKKIASLLKTHDISIYNFKDSVIYEKQEICKNDGTPYTIYTPFKNKWLRVLHQDTIHHFASADLTNRFLSFKPPPVPSLGEIGFKHFSFAFPPKKIPRDIIKNYHLARDFPALCGTSRLGLHIRFGALSIRELVQTALVLNETWLSELIWREFFTSILSAFPHVSNASFRRKYDQIQWRNNPDEFEKWCNGQTGYPMVDAGMRELNNTGFMHNRTRMITAGFLTKHLLIDWRWGERYFAEKLLDYDLAANNGNWQWAAGTGCDAVPYFRIFNPDRQMKRFDPDKKYVRQWVPDYKSDDYPKPIVDHNFARQRALATYKTAISEAQNQQG